MKCRKCRKPMKLVMTSVRYGRFGGRGGSLYECETEGCGESCSVEGLGRVDWGDRWKPQLKKSLEEMRKRVSGEETQ